MTEQNRTHIPYHKLNIKTNRNTLGETLNFGISLPPNHQNRVNTLLRKNGVVQKITLPRVLYHTTLKPIETLKANHIFYLSYDKFQSMAHGIDRLKNAGINDFMYVYEFEPLVKTMSVVRFDETIRPKTVSNTDLNVRFNKASNKGMFMYEFSKQLTKNQMLNRGKHGFDEGSGDNMIIGQLLCKSGQIDGVRNTHDQDEIGVCNPNRYFKVKNYTVYPATQLHMITKNLQNGLIFNKTQTPYGYKFRVTSNNSNTGYKLAPNMNRRISNLVTEVNALPNAYYQTGAIRKRVVPVSRRSTLKNII